MYQTTVERLYPDSLAIRDERFASFLPLLFGGALFKAAKKGATWLAGKAAGAARSALQRVVAAPPAEEAPPEQEEEGYETSEEVEEDAVRLFDIHYSNDEVVITSPAMRALGPHEFEQMATAIGSEVAAALDSLSGIRYDEVSDYPEQYELGEPDARFASFKKFKKLAKKLMKVAMPLAGSLIPGGSMVTGLIGGLTGGKKERQQAAAPLVQAVQQPAPQFQFPTPSQFYGEYGETSYAPPRRRVRYRAPEYEEEAGFDPELETYYRRPTRRLRSRFEEFEAPEYSYDEEGEEVEVVAEFDASDFDWETFDGESGTTEETDPEVLAESARIHEAAEEVYESYAQDHQWKAGGAR